MPKYLFEVDDSAGTQGLLEEGDAARGPRGPREIDRASKESVKNRPPGAK